MHVANDGGLLLGVLEGEGAVVGGRLGEQQRLGGGRDEHGQRLSLTNLRGERGTGRGWCVCGGGVGC